jgi:hypothetical protein
MLKPLYQKKKATLAASSPCAPTIELVVLSLVPGYPRSQPRFESRVPLRV